MARHAGVEIGAEDWSAAYDLPLIVNMQPAGKYLGERFHRAGGVPAVMWELLQAGRLHGDCLTVRSEEHTSELQSLMRISYAVFCLKKKKPHNAQNTRDTD